MSLCVKRDARLVELTNENDNISIWMADTVHGGGGGGGGRGQTLAWLVGVLHSRE